MIKQSFNRGWNFQVGDPGTFGALMGGNTQAIPVDLPHDAEIHAARGADEKSGSGNGFFHADDYTYTKTFEVKEEDADRITYIEFEGVYQNAYVYVNNSFAAKHPYGYGNFYIDVTKFLVPGTNQIKVVAKNAGPSGRWYTGGGIYRDVNIMVSNRLHLIPDGIHLATVELEDGEAVIRAESSVSYQGLGVKDVTLAVELRDADGSTAAFDEIPFTLNEGETKTYRQRLYVENPKLWDAENPYLYTYRASVMVDGDEVDAEEGTFGIRMLSLDHRHGLRVNGKVVNLRGGCLHHDNGVIGTAEFAHAEKVRVRNLKRAGFNAIRSSHYPMSRRLVEACDELGMYIMDEFSDVWMTTKVVNDYGMNMSDWWEYDVTNIVNKDYNHPSVILYSIGNEIPENGNRFDTQWGKAIADKFHELDDTRYTTNAVNILLAVINHMPEIMAELGIDPGVAQGGGEINQMMTDIGALMGAMTNTKTANAALEEACAQVDVVGFNYAAERYEPDGEAYPNRIIVGSETYPEDLDKNWDLVEKLPYVIGDFDWTAYDYLGEAGIGKITYGDDSRGMSFYAPYPCKAAYCGDINLIGDARPTAYWRKTIWKLSEAPYIAVCPPAHFGEKVNKTQWAMTDAIRSWNWSGYEGKPVRIEVYSDADEIELLINGASAGRKKVGEAKKDIAYFETTYQPGKVEAVAYKDGGEVSRDELVTASDDVHMAVIADAAVIPADGSDICYVELALQDTDGNLNPEVVKSVSVKAEGAGCILGFGSADPDSEENYFDTTAKTFEGRLRAAVRANKAGEIRVTFSAEGMDDAVVTVKAE